MILPPYIETKIVFIAASVATYGFSFNTLISIIVMIVADYLIRMATAGFTFKYKTYPSGVSQKMQNTAYWISMFIIIVATYLFNHS